jgi:hypothetical protein
VPKAPQVHQVPQVPKMPAPLVPQGVTTVMCYFLY